MIQEDYVSFEVAKLLKEKGFVTPCDWLYCSNGTFGHRNSIWDKEMFPAPTCQMAMKWLREKCHIVIGINIGNENKNGNTDYSNPDRWWYFWEWTNDRGVYKEELQPNALNNEYPTYEKAVEAALRYSLENLI